MPRSFEILTVDRVFDGFFAVDRAEVRFETVAGGVSGPYERLSVERGDAAAALVHRRDTDTFLFVRQFRYPCVAHGNAWLIEAAAGKIEAGESPEAAVRREVSEELGYRVGDVTEVASFYGSPGGLSELTHIFYAPVTAADKTHEGGGVDHGEDVEIVELPSAEAVRMALGGQIRDAKALVALLWFASRRG